MNNTKLVVFLNTALGNYLFATLYIPIIGLFVICSSIAFDHRIQREEKLNLTVIGGIQAGSLIILLAWIISTMQSIS